MRTAETMRQNFISKPGDKYIIPINSHCLSSGMSFQVVNENESFSISCDNTPAVWDLLKRLDNMGGRSVWVQIDSNEPTPFKSSAAYKSRFEH